MAAPTGATVSGLNKGEIASMPQSSYYGWNQDASKLGMVNVPQFKGNFEFKAGGQSGLDPRGNYYSNGGQTAIPLGSETVYRNTPTGVRSKPNVWTEATDPLARAGNFKEALTNVKIPGIGQEEWRGLGPQEQQSIYTSIYNPEYAKTLKQNAGFTPRMQKTFESLSKGESPDVSAALEPRAVASPYTHGGYTYGGFKDFGDVSGLGESIKKKSDDKDLRNKFLNTPDYYGKESKYSNAGADGMYSGERPTSRGGSQGDPNRLGQFFNWRSWREVPGVDQISKFFS